MGRRYHAFTYVAIRTRDVLGYVEYCESFWSTPDEKEQDAERLYGKKGYTLRVVPKGTLSQRELTYIGKGIL